MPDPTSTGMRTEVLSPLSDEVRLILPQPDVKGTTAAKHPEFGSKHSLRGRYPDHVLVDIRPSGASGYVDYIYEVLPTTPRVIEEIDPDKGVVYKHVYRDQLASTLPVKGATTLLGTDLDAGRYVYRAGENPIGGTLAEVTVVTVLPPGPLRMSPTTHDIYGPTRTYEQFVLSSTALPDKGSIYPAASGRNVLSARIKDEDGVFSTMEIVSILLPGVLRVTEVTDADYGVVFKYEQFVAATTAVPELGSIYQGRYVISARMVDQDSVFGTVEVVTSASQLGTIKNDSQIDKIFCVSDTLKRRVPSTHDMSVYQRGVFISTGTVSGYVLDATMTDDDGTNASVVVRLASTNQVTVVETKLDMETGRTYSETTQYLLTSSAPSGYAVQADATYRETKKIDCNFWVTTTSKTTTLTTESYPVVIPYKWPAVLLSFRWQALYDRSNTYVVKYLTDYNLKREYVGECRGQYTRSWTKNAPTAEAPTPMIPEGINYNGIAMQLSIPACLHWAITISESTGTQHPTYRYAAYTANYPATNRQTWPSSIVSEVNIERYRGGFIKEKMLVYAPT